MKAGLVEHRVEVESSDIVVDPVVLLTATFILTVLLLHHGSYTHDYIWRLRQIEVNQYLQKMAVGGFLFLSGYKLMLSKAGVSAIAFWKNRLIRIYPPYLLALVAYSFTDYVYKQESLPSIGNFLLHASLLQSVLPDLLGKSYRTLWFVSVLFCCYVFFLMARRLVQRMWLYVASVVLLVLAICVVRNVLASSDIDVFLKSFEVFLVYFSGGMLYAAQQQTVHGLIRQNMLLYKGIVVGATLLFAAVKLWLIASNAPQSTSLYCFDFIATLATTIPLYLLFLSGTIELRIKQSSLAKRLQQLSVASFFVFLCHRPIWSVLASIWNDSGFVHSLYIFGVGLPTIFALSLWGQVTYSRLVKRW